MRTYAAVAAEDGTFIVCNLGPYEIKPVLDIRPFTTFEEADDVALACSYGDYNHHKGHYVCMR